jgi:low temperature requirement protein LtrA
MSDTPKTPRIRATLRQEETVTPLELFFDLVFVLAITQCTALMSSEPTWEGMARGLLVLAVLWWAWVGYAWLTSVVNPEEGAVRIVMFGAMAALLVTALCVPRVFDSEATLFVAAYAFVRAGQLALFALASRGDPHLARSIAGLAVSSGIAVGLLFAAAATDGAAQGLLWLVAILLDLGGPFVFGSEGWKLSPHHFAERHGLIVIIALGESIVAIGVGASASVDAGTVVAAVVGIAIAAGLWWLYFDVTALAATQNLASMPPGKERNELARDAYSYLHFPLVAGVVLVAFGLKKILGDVGEPLDRVPDVALLGGTAMYLLALVGLRLRHIARLARPRLVLALVLVAAIPLGTEIDSLLLAVLVAVLLAATIAWEAVSLGERRHELRHAPRDTPAHE